MDEDVIDLNEDDIAYDDYDERYEYGFGLGEYDVNGNLIEEDEEEELGKAGRPRKYYTEPKQIHLKCSGYEYRMFRELAELSHKSVSKCIKDLAFEKLETLKSKT